MLTHRLPSAMFDALAEGRGGSEAVRMLRATQRSRRLLLLRAVIDAAERVAAERRGSAALRSGYDLLTSVQRRASATVDALLLHPHVGSWAASCLRQLCDSSTDLEPSDTDLGHLAAVAAAAAIRAGRAFEIAVPVRDGTVLLPTLGMARLGSGAGERWATVRSVGETAAITLGDEEVVLPADRSAAARGWQPLRRISVRADRRLDVFVDDMGPFRDTGWMRVAAPLDDATFMTWRDRIQGAWSLLARHHPARADEIAAGLVSLVPLADTEASDWMSTSSTDAFGTIALTLSDEPGLAVSLVHEFQHAKLGALLQLFPLCLVRDDEWFYAPWHADPRPLDRLLHGTYAFLSVADFWRVHRNAASAPQAAFAQVEFARWRAAITRAVEALQASGRLTAYGIRFVAGMRSALLRWLDEPVPPELLGVAEGIVADHRMTWRLRNLRPDPDSVAALAESWRTGAPRPSPDRVPQALVAGVHEAARTARLGLIHLRLKDPDRFERRVAEPCRSAAGTTVATSADIAYARGDHAEAAAAYRDQLIARPDRLSAWSGLGVTSGGDTARALRSHPEIVAAVYRHLRQAHGITVEPMALAEWLAPVQPV